MLVVDEVLLDFILQIGGRGLHVRAELCHQLVHLHHRHNVSCHADEEKTCRENAAPTTMRPGGEHRIGDIQSKVRRLALL